MIADRTEHYDRRREQGMAAFVVTTALVMVMTLIAVGFAFSVRQTARQSLDSQLAQQALRTAESGADMAVAIVQDKVAAGVAYADKTECAANADFPNISFDEIDSEVTCLLVDKSVERQTYSNVGGGSVAVASLETNNGPMNSITVRWASEGSGSLGCMDATMSHARPTNWNCRAGLLRIELAPRANGVNNSSTVIFAYPYDNSLSPAGSVTLLGTLTPWMWGNASCDAVMCSLTISSPLVSLADYYVAMRSLYRNSSVSIDGVLIAGGVADFTGQMSVDVTARATDVIKRIKVTAPTNRSLSTGVPAFALEATQSLCKKFEISSARFNDLGCAP